MTVKITRPEGGTGVEVLGGARLHFVRNVARVTGYASQLRPSVAAALRRRGYEVENERKSRPRPAEGDRSPVNGQPTPPPAAPVVDEPQADELATVVTADGAEHVGILPASAAGSDVDVDGVGTGE